MIAEAIATKFCSRCEDFYPPTLEHFYNNASRKDGLSPYCRKCQREIVRTGYQRRMERIKASPSEYAKYLETVRRVNNKYAREHPGYHSERYRRVKAKQLERKLKMVKR
jgi:hypothetical protein